MNRARKHGPTNGVVLIVSLWLVAFLSLLVFSFLRQGRVELRIASGFADRIRARELAKAGIARAEAVLAADETPHDDATDVWRHSEEDFREHVLGPDGYFSLLYNNLDESAEIAYGLCDENGKICVNTAPADVLEKLPGMDAEIAAAIVDWIDTDDKTEDGAESDYYESLDPPYAAKNGPLDTVEELLFVRGITPELLYGEDANRNGILDANEDDGDETYPPDDHDGVLDGGLLDFLTVYSYEMNVAADGTARANINEEDAGKRKNDLRKALGPIIGQGRANRIADEIAQYSQLMKNVNSDFKFVSPANLLSPVTSLSVEEYRQVADYMSVSADPKVEGLINVNTARREVLEAVCETLENFEDQDVDKITAFRTGEDADLDDIGWVLEALEGDQTKFQLLAPFLTVRSGQFLIQSVGVVAPRKVFCRILAVLDRIPKPPVLLYWKDASGLGAPFLIRSIEDIESDRNSSTNR
jgi:type II secretory pathway component PulK